jgi:polyisoprenyl-teichoic acid--peptidoglycan teichoic acid transferase
MAQPRSSIDGFVPSNQGRHVGFGYDTHRLSGPGSNPAANLPRVRMRRPGLHTTPSATPAGPNLSTSRLTERNNFPEFTTYTASTATASNSSNSSAAGTIGRDGGFGGKSGAPSGRRRRHGFGRQSGNDKSGSGRGKSGGSFWRRTSWKKVFKRTGIALFALLLIGGGYFGWKIARTTTKVFGGDSNVLGFLNSSTLKGEDKGRVNILVAGVSTDDPGHEGGNLTDSIMLVSLDTKNHQAFLLSIPRDMWVNVPGYGHSKINAANAFGDTGSFSAPGYPSGGMGLLEEVVSQNFQIPIHYYAKINYSAFRDAVNAVGGISVNVQSEDKRGFYDPNISKADQGPLKLANGVQMLNGQTALNFARARGDPTGDGRVAYGYARSDFTRTQNQRLMMLSLKDKITSGGVITNPVKISQLFDVVGKNMKTDLQPSEIRRLYDINKQIKGSDVASLSLNSADGVNLLANYRSPDGESALAPAAGLDAFGAIQLYLKKQMTNDPVVKESAKVVILNGGDTTGLASKMSNYVTGKGINVVSVDDGPHTVGGNIIIDQTTKTTSGASAKPATKARLLQLFGSGSGTAAAGSAGYPTADFVIILGTNQATPSTE